MSTTNIIKLATRRRKSGRRNAFGQAMSCLGEYEVLKGPGGVPYVSLRSGGRWETFAVDSQAFTDRLTVARIELDQAPLSPQLVRPIQQRLRAEASATIPDRSVGLRVARFGDELLIDLCNSDWQTVRIGKATIRVEHQAEVRFIRHSGMLPLPNPDLEGDLNELRPLLGSLDESMWHLFVGALLAAFHPSGPYPLIIISGAHRSGKSRASKLFRLLVDPSWSLLRSLPKTQDDLWVTAQNEWLLAFDNVSYVAPALSDELCRVSTGGGASTRQFYSNYSQVLFDAKRPVLLNGIAPELTRPDLIDRGLFIQMPQLATDQAMSEAYLDSVFSSLYSRIFGGICKALQCALRNQESTKLRCDGRLIDVVQWVSAAEEYLGWSPGTFAAEYSNNHREARMTVLQDNPLFLAIRELLDRHRGEWRGTATALLHELGSVSTMRDPNWPRHPRQLRDRLTRIMPFLPDAGMAIAFSRSSSADRERIITLLQQTMDAPAEGTSTAGAEKVSVPAIRTRVRSRG